MMRFVHVDTGCGHHYRTGEIIKAVSEEFYLVRFDYEHGPEQPFEMISLSEMTETLPEMGKLWRFFETAEARQAWMDWLEVPLEDAPKPKIVSIKPD